LQICQFLLDTKDPWEAYVDETAEATFMRNGKSWISYSGTWSMKKKVSVFIFGMDVNLSSFVTKFGGTHRIHRGRIIGF
jgi:hypothetical protein